MLENSTNISERPGMNSLRKFFCIVIIAVAYIVPTTLCAQAPTSREINFDLLLSRLPFGSTQNLTVQVWDASTGGNLIFSEVHPNVKIGFLGELDLLLGSLTPGGIPFGHFRRRIIPVSGCLRCNPS